MAGEQLRQAYETLRAQAGLAGPAAPAPRGLALFLRSGLAGWMQTWKRLVASPPPTRSMHQPELTVTRSSESGPELTILLVQMALAGPVANLVREALT